MVLCQPLYVGRPLGFAPEATLEDLGLPQGGPGVEVRNCLSSRNSAAPGTQGSWQLRQQEI